MQTVVSEAGILIKTALQAFQFHRGHLLAAALAYYAMIAVVPLFMILIWAINVLMNEQYVLYQFSLTAHNYLGPAIGQGVTYVLQSIVTGSISVGGSIVAFIAVFVTTTALIVHIREILATVWGIPVKQNKMSLRTLMSTIHLRAASFVLVLCITMLFVASFFSTIIISSIIRHAADRFAFPGVLLIITLLNYMVVLLLVTLIFLLIFRFLIQTSLLLRDLFRGALMTGALFVFGQLIIGIYFNMSSNTTALGITGSVIAVLLWMYYSAMIFVLGSEFTCAYARIYKGWKYPKVGGV